MKPQSPVEPGKPPLRLRRFLVRLGVLILVVWGSPASIVAIEFLTARGVYEASAAVYVAFGALCHLAGRFVGRFERDTPVQFGIGCCWPYVLIGIAALCIENADGFWCVAAAAPLFVVGFLAAKRSFGRRSRLRSEGRCVFCEYDLSGLGGGAMCPECGQRFESGVEKVDQPVSPGG